MLAGRGFGRGSGVLEGLTREQDVELRKALARRLGGVDVAEAQAGEAEATREDIQEFAASESALDRGLAREMEEGRLTLAEAQLAQSAGQFDTELDFRRWATERGFEENEINRAWSTSERIGGQEFVTGEREAGQAFVTGERLSSQEFQTGILGMQQSFATGQLILADELEKNRDNDTRIAQTAYNLGLAGQELPPDMAENGIAVNAYRAGQAGTAVQDAERQWISDIDFRNAQIAGLDPDSPEFQNDLRRIFGKVIDTEAPVNIPETSDEDLLSRRDEMIKAFRADPTGADIDELIRINIELVSRGVLTKEEIQNDLRL
jgi:hypothetical protein